MQKQSSYKVGDLIKVTSEAHGSQPTYVAFKRIDSFISFKECRGKIGVVVDTFISPSSKELYHTVLISGKVVSFIQPDMMVKICER